MFDCQQKNDYFPCLLLYYNINAIKSLTFTQPNNGIQFKAFTANCPRHQFPNDEDRDGSRNVGSLAVHPPDAAASLAECY